MKTSERLREGRLPAEGLALVAERDDRVIATVRLWHVEAGPRRPALLLGRWRWIRRARASVWARDSCRASCGARAISATVRCC